MNNLIARAEAYARKAHYEQVRDDGLPYIVHPALVASLIMQVTHDQEMIAAAWLHDTIEDTDTTYEDLVREFGQGVADLVNEVTHEGKHDHKGYYFPRLKTARGVILKFADRLANLSTMNGAWDEKRQAHYLKKSKFWEDQ